jgi:hypothetical protein
MAHWILNFTRRGTKDKKLMPQQAKKLLEAGMWGVPATAQAREKLAPGDRVLVYVGAPDRVFVGDATLNSTWHSWNHAEVAAYPGGFDAGVTLTDCRVWQKPLPLGNVWPQTAAAKTNPKARWYGAVASLPGPDFDLILDAAAPGSHSASPPTPSTAFPAHASTKLSAGIAESGALFKVAERLKQYLASPKPITEDGTRAFFIDKWLDALGYSDFDDVEHGSAVASGDYPDYVLRSNGSRVVAVEAKRIGHPLGSKEAAQLVKYGSVLGLRWGLLTDGRILQVYDLPVTGVPPEDRLVLSVDLADFADRDDFDSRIWPAAALLRKDAMASGNGLEQHAARELIRTVLSDPSSAPIGALQADLQARKVVLSHPEVTALVQDLLG